MEQHSIMFREGQTSKSDIPPNVAPKNVTPEKYLQIWDSYATLIVQLSIETLFGAIIGGTPLSGSYPFGNVQRPKVCKVHKRYTLVTKLHHGRTSAEVLFPTISAHFRPELHDES